MRLAVLCVSLALLGLIVAGARHPNHRSKLQESEEDGSALGRDATTFQLLGFPGAHNCTTRWFTQFIDHFNFGVPEGTGGETTYQQRYLTYDGYYKPGGPIFFYTGNELGIRTFANIAGLMWQNAEQFGAALVFAEHRFYGQSQPCGGNVSCFPYLSTQQAMADYAVLLTNLTTDRYKDSVGVITFGGSYGGMLSAWMRIKYPNIITGSISSSGPITMVSRSFPRELWWSATTYDATAEGGSAPDCAHNVYLAQEAAFEMLKTASGRTRLGELMQTCHPIEEKDAKYLVAMFSQSAWGAMAMGNYPYVLNFIFGTVDQPAPAWPVRLACEYLRYRPADNETLILNWMAAMNVINNITQNVPCNPLNVDYTDSGNWDYQVCTTEVPDSQPYFESQGWPTDMFYRQPKYTKEMMDEHCFKKYGVTTRWGWYNTTYGAANVQGATNIVFINGLLDPWHTGGILQNVSSTVKAYIVTEGAHHLDLFFDMPSDTHEVRWVRRKAVEHIREWLNALK